MPTHKSNVSDQKIAALAYAIAANHHPPPQTSPRCMRQGAHRTYARPHSTEQRRSPKPVTAERDIYPPEFNVNVPKILHNSLFFFNNVPRGYITMGLSIPVQRTNRKARWDRMAKASAKSKTLSTAVALAMAASLSVPFTAYADEDANASQEATQQEETTAATSPSTMATSTTRPST